MARNINRSISVKPIARPEESGRLDRKISKVVISKLLRYNLKPRARKELINERCVVSEGLVRERPSGNPSPEEEEENQRRPFPS